MDLKVVYSISHITTKGIVVKRSKDIGDGYVKSPEDFLCEKLGRGAFYDRGLAVQNGREKIKNKIVCLKKQIDKLNKLLKELV